MVLFLILISISIFIEKDETFLNEKSLEPNWVYHKDGQNNLFHFSAPKDWELYTNGNTINTNLFFGYLVKHTNQNTNANLPDFIFLNLMLKNKTDQESRPIEYYTTQTGKTIKIYRYEINGRILEFKAIANTGQESEKLLSTFDKIAQSLIIYKN